MRGGSALGRWRHAERKETRKSQKSFLGGRIGQALDFYVLVRDNGIDTREVSMATKKPKPKYRSAITGRYVSKKYAEKHPKTTVREIDRPRKKTKKK